MRNVPRFHQVPRKGSRPRKARKGKKRNVPMFAESAEAITVTPEMLSAARKAVSAALGYERATGDKRKLGITGEVGEVLCCHELGLRLCVDSRSKGFDAIDSRGKRVEIKTRRSESDDLPRDAGRLSKFSEHEFDYVLVVLLDRKYRIAEIWRAEYTKVLTLIGSQKRRNPSLAAIKRVAKRIRA